MTPVKITVGNELADTVMDLTNKRQSAFLMVVRRSGPFIGIGVLEGKMTYLKCGSAEGDAVLPMLGHVQPGDHFLSYPPRPNARTTKLPDFKQILAAMGQRAPAPGTAPSPLSQVNSVSPNSGISREQLSDALCPVLRRYVGPMTDVLCDEAMGSLPRPIPRDFCLRLVESLARNLKDPKKSLEFTVAAEGRVKAMFD